jgi:hypothetical protein
MNSDHVSEKKDNTSSAKLQDATETIAVNPNPAANNNIITQLSDMNDAQRNEASGSLNNEITDGEDG